jgi:hypothetical protein
MMNSKSEAIKVGGRILEVEKFESGEFWVRVDGEGIASGEVTGLGVLWNNGRDKLLSAEVEDVESWLFCKDAESPNENPLLMAVQDLLAELRIDELCLEKMAEGYSPDYPGAIDLAEGEMWNNPHCKVQISKVVARKLIDAGVLDHLKEG